MHASLLLLVLLLVTPPATDIRDANDPRTRTTIVKKSAPQRLVRYQVAAGTALLLKMRTAFDSASASVNDQVEASLWSPVVQDGVELIPEGSVVIGNVVDVVRASEKTPFGSVTFAFNLIEHGDTGDRAKLVTRRITIAAPRPPAASGRKGARPAPTDASIPEGASFVAMTAEPLIVLVPRTQ